METFFTNFSEVHRFLTYLLIFGGIFIEGEIVLIIAGVLIRAGNIDFFDTIIIAFIGTVAHDIFYWQLGRWFFASQKDRFFFLNVGKLGPFLTKIHKNDSYIFTSKFTWAFNRLILIASGYGNMPMRKLLRHAVPAAFIWVVTLVSLGYIFADKTDLLKKNITTIIFSITLFVVVLYILENVFQRTLSFKKIKNEDISEKI
ncbi:hypothetical protein A2Z10_01655 [Candidatus Azambacteria bacterium RBG_16_47_10]|uniref:DedA family protein n=1 Tax=Candidatus Azambacteria bacterium RBG_16_47_10 TaxID=1797292 RepID=A0A1F5B1A6_9BACT|nr:MAG: hypothetical protein A2Z10_01655 [Candidatus Azambacteria bacterium RBG_16_47_10]